MSPLLGDNYPLAKVDNLIDLVQTAALVTVTLAVVYALYMLRREVFHAAATLRDVQRNQQSITSDLARFETAIRQLEQDVKDLKARR